MAERLNLVLVEIESLTLSGYKCQMIKIKDVSKDFELQMNMIRRDFSSMLISTLSHETFTPLNAIINFSLELVKRYEARLNQESGMLLRRGWTVTE